MKRQKYFVVLTVLFLFCLGLLFWAYVFVMPSVQYQSYQKELRIHATADTIVPDSKELVRLQRTEQQLKNKIARLTPGSVFLIINTTDNTFSLYQQNQIIRTGNCSTGSLVKLEIDSLKSYLFETPKGVFTVRNKLTNPVWRKPDWAFLEEGLPVPAPFHASRYEKNVLGDYALNLGNGYLIHGTLYQRLIGMPVTHGCVRLKDDDLEVVYKAMEVGSKVYIY
jgi:lipoprotein-anchoring transpeptidase ErfK/SrfK